MVFGTFPVRDFWKMAGFDGLLYLLLTLTLSAIAGECRVVLGTKVAETPDITRHSEGCMHGRTAENASVHPQRDVHLKNFYEHLKLSATLKAKSLGQFQQEDGQQIAKRWRQLFAITNHITDGDHIHFPWNSLLLR